MKYSEFIAEIIKELKHNQAYDVMHGYYLCYIIEKITDRTNTEHAARLHNAIRAKIHTYNKNHIRTWESLSFLALTATDFDIKLHYTKRIQWLKKLQANAIKKGN